MKPGHRGASSGSRRTSPGTLAPGRQPQPSYGRWNGRSGRVAGTRSPPSGCSAHGGVGVGPRAHPAPHRRGLRHPGRRALCRTGGARCRRSADGAALVLPGLDGEWVLEIAVGHPSLIALIGIVRPDRGRSMSVLRPGSGLRVADLAHEPTLRIPANNADGSARPKISSPRSARPMSTRWRNRWISSVNTVVLEPNRQWCRWIRSRLGKQSVWPPSQCGLGVVTDLSKDLCGRPYGFDEHGRLPIEMESVVGSGDASNGFSLPRPVTSSRRARSSASRSAHSSVKASASPAHELSAATGDPT